MVMEVWLVDLDRSAAGLEMIERQCGRLSSEDIARIAETRAPELARQRRLSTIALRLLIARFAGSGKFDRVAMRRLAGGKPVLDGGGPAFSLAHAGGRALVAIGDVAAIGVDLEPDRRLRMGPERQRLLIDAAAPLVAGEAQPLDGTARARHGGDERAALRAWVRLEAYAKAMGAGIGRVLTERGVIARSRQVGSRGGQAGPASTERPAVVVRDLQVPADAGGGVWFGAVAVTGEGAEAAMGSLSFYVLPEAAEALVALTTRA